MTLTRVFGPRSRIEWDQPSPRRLRFSHPPDELGWRGAAYRPSAPGESFRILGRAPQLPEHLWVELVNPFNMSHDEPPLTIQP